jgi:hypothetical protein
MSSILFIKWENSKACHQCGSPDLERGGYQMRLSESWRSAKPLLSTNEAGTPLIWMIVLLHVPMRHGCIAMPS